MTIKLGVRLRTIAELVPPGSKLVDIGSDHGYLPAWLLLNGRIAKAVAGEINTEPAQRALHTCREYCLESRMDVRLGDGLSVIAPGEADIAVIAGMGGGTIRRILDEGRSVLYSFSRLILQPNVGAPELRKWLVGNRFTIVNEALAQENGILYQIIVVAPGQTRALSDLEALLGPVLLQERPPLFPQFLEDLLLQRRYILSQLCRSRNDGVDVKRAQLLREIEDLEAVRA